LRRSSGRRRRWWLKIYVSVSSFWFCNEDIPGHDYGTRIVGSGSWHPVGAHTGEVASDRDFRNSHGMAPKRVESLLALAFSMQTTIGTKNDSA
jgi:hypothetical protein